jgi:hypothetical protein
MLGKTTRQGLLYTDWKWFEHSSAISQISIKCLPSNSSLIDTSNYIMEQCKI